MANDLKFEDEVQTLSEILETQSLPIVVRIYDEGNQSDAEFDVCRSKISGKTEVLLQNQLKVKCCHIKVLNFYDNNVVQKEKGPEYVLEHDTFVGEEYLIPLKYHGKLKFVHRPGSWRRYAAVSQLISELPRYIRLAVDTVALPSNGIGKNIIVSAKTVLEVVRKFKQTNDGITYLECSDGNVSYAFSEKERINCTEVDDTKLYNLFELVRFKLLPKVILFEDVAPKDNILMDNEFNSAMSTAVEGPVELLGFVDVHVLVGWVRDKEEKTFKTVLIPQSLWNDIMVQERSLHGEEEKQSYVKRKYPRCNDTNFVEKSLYMMPVTKRQVTWLRSPECYVRTLSGMHMFEAIPREITDSSDEEEQDQDYIEIPEEPPPVPERKPVPHHDTHEHEGVAKRIQEKKSLFHKVHKELFGWFKQNDAKAVQHSQDKPPDVPERPHHYPSRSLSESAYGDHGYTAHKHTRERASSERHIRRPPSPVETPPHDAQPEPEMELHDYDYPDVDRVTAAFRAASERAANQHRALPDPPKSPVMASPVRPVETHSRLEGDGMSNATRSAYSTSVRRKENPKYVSVQRKQVEHIFRDDLTQDDFFNYTVLETFHCFKHCGLEEFAERCQEQKLDGSFFKNFDLNELKNEPFNLSSFSVLKVKKMIFDGWRPNYKN